MTLSKNDAAWIKLFDDFNIVREVGKQGFFEISSTQINRYREARLMTKFDHRSQLPNTFSDNNFSILPITRGSYIIGPFDTFAEFEEDQAEIVKIEFPTFLESLDFRNITSESTAINCAFVSNILHDFTEEENLLPTVSGRMSSSKFSFQISAIPKPIMVSVDNSQIEIDGGYEGDRFVSLIEAKNYISKDFLIRQLYYPVRLWDGKVTKRIKPIFLTYSNGIFHLREYYFSDINNYNSLVLVKERKYIIRDGAVNIETIQNICSEVQIVPEPEIPFPQANSFDRVINLCELLNQRDNLSKDEITANYDFDKRQTDYYCNACKYLGLIETKKEGDQVICVLTNTGQNLFKETIVDRQLTFVKLILSHAVFNATLQAYLQNGGTVTKDEIVDLMKSTKIYNVDAEKTFHRRASTILGWINWIIGLIEE